jgi:hypothetical protein
MQESKRLRQQLQEKRMIDRILENLRALICKILVNLIQQHDFMNPDGRQLQRLPLSLSPLTDARFPAASLGDFTQQSTAGALFAPCS